MKNIIVLFATAFFTINSSFASSDPMLSNEIRQKLKIDLSTIRLDQYSTDFVDVKFKIYDGVIKIIKIEASQLELKELVMTELLEIHIRTPYNENEIHNFNFTFEKK